MSKEVTSIVISWQNTDGSTGTASYNAASLGQTVARQRAASRTAIIHEAGGKYTATEFYKDGSRHEFEN